MTPRIRLNFLALTPQPFTVAAWRQRIDPDDKKPPEPNVWRYDLPENASGDDSAVLKTYLIRFTPTPGFDSITTRSTFNRDFTKAALFNGLRTRVESSLSTDKYFVSRAKYRPRRIFFVMNKTSLGRQTVWMEPYFLDATAQFGFLIDFRFVKNPNVNFNRDVQRLSLSLDRNFRSNKDFYIDRFEFVSRFLHEMSRSVFPFLVSPGCAVSVDLSLQELPVERLGEKVFIFGNNVKSSSQWNGLNKGKPFAPAPKSVCFIYVYRKFQRTLAEDLYKALDGKVSEFPFPGIQKLTGLQVGGYEKIEIADLSAAQIDIAINQIAEIAKERKNDCVLPLFISDKDNSDAYYRLKCGLLNHEIPVQVVTAQLIGNRSSLKWSVANIALQVFSKAGGTAWRVQPSTEECLIFGIGQAHKKDGDIIHRYFAYSVCTDSTGAYKKIAILGDNVEQKDYLRQLRERIVAEVKAMSGDYKQCVIHVPFTIRKEEIRAINEALGVAVSERQLPSIELSVIKVNSWLMHRN